MGKLMNAKEYEESLRKLKLNVYMFGKKVESPVDDPIIRPSMNAVKPPTNSRTSRSTKTS